MLFRSLDFDRKTARGMRLNIAAGTAVRFEPGQSRTIELVELAGAKTVFGFQGKVMGALLAKASTKTAKSVAKKAVTVPLSAKEKLIAKKVATQGARR